MSINLGDRAKAHVTNLIGIVTAKSKHLYGCDRIGIQPEGLDKDGKPHDTYWFDEMGVEVINPKAIEGDKRETKTGGPALPGQTPMRENPK